MRVSGLPIGEMCIAWSYNY